jgi:hypothetical protein
METSFSFFAPTRASGIGALIRGDGSMGRVHRQGFSWKSLLRCMVLGMAVMTGLVLPPAGHAASTAVESSSANAEAPRQAPARNSLVAAGNWYLDAIVSWGVSGNSVTEGEGSPTINQLGVGATAAWRFSPHFFLGLSNDYRTAGQYSDVLSSVGDVSGARANWLAPTIGFSWRDFVLKVDAQWLGDYRISDEPGKSGSLTLGRPRGWRIGALYPILQNLHVGAQLESVAFGTRSRDGGREQSLDRPVAIWQAALTAGLVF